MVSPRRSRRLPPGMPGRPRRGGRAAPGPGTDTPAGTGAGTGEAAPRGWLPGLPRLEEWPDGEWVVRDVPREAAVKLYRCPGCDQEIAVATAHVVVWPAEAPGPAERRHWHRGCWQRRPRRPGGGPRPARW